MYKATARFQDYIERKNVFVDRILAGGNRIDTAIVSGESDAELLLDAANVLSRLKAALEQKHIKLRGELKDLRRNTHGRPDRQLPPATADRIKRLTIWVNDARADSELVRNHLQLINMRLAQLGAD